MKEPLMRIELALVRVWRGAICPACGKAKASKRPVCKTCYFALDAKTKNAIHARLDEDQWYDIYLQVIDGLIKAGVGKRFANLPEKARRAFEEMGIADALDLSTHAPVKLWIVLDAGQPLIYGPNGMPAIARKSAEGFRDYALAYKLRELRLREYFKQANKETLCSLVPCSGVACAFHGLIAKAYQVAILRVEAK